MNIDLREFLSLCVQAEGECRAAHRQYYAGGASRSVTDRLARAQSAALTYEKIAVQLLKLARDTPTFGVAVTDAYGAAEDEGHSGQQMIEAAVSHIIENLQLGHLLGD